VSNRCVAAVIGAGALTFDLAVPCEVFGLDRSDIDDPWYDFRLVSADETPIRTSTGFTIDTPYRLDDVEAAGTVIVPGWCDPEQRPSADLVDALRAAHARGARVVSLCTGAFVLADAGLLDGRRATTHWMYAERLRLAQRLLEETDVPVAQVASRSGFPSVAAMRATFTERLMVSPLQYRRTFRSSARELAERPSYVDDARR
jgi:transcriptional regulator GlxA family with amidase domain